MTTHPALTTDTDNPITDETITTHATRPEDEEQTENRAGAEAVNRTDHNHSNKRTCTPRHHDLMATLAGPYGPAGQTDQHREARGPRHPRRGAELHSRHGRNLTLSERFADDASSFHDRGCGKAGPPPDQRKRGATVPGQRRNDGGGAQ